MFLMYSRAAERVDAIVGVWEPDNCRELVKKDEERFRKARKNHRTDILEHKTGGMDAQNQIEES